MSNFLEFKKDFVKLGHYLGQYAIFSIICLGISLIFSGVSSMTSFASQLMSISPSQLLSLNLSQLTSQEIIALIEFIFAGIQLILFIRIIRMFHFIAEKSHDINLDRTYRLYICAQIFLFGSNLMTFIAVTNYFLALLHILPSISAQMLTVFSIISNFLIQTSFGVVLEIFGFILLLAGFRALSQWANLYIESRYNAPLANKIGEKLILVKWGVVLSIFVIFGSIAQILLFIGLLQLSAALIAEFSQNFETQPEIMNIKTKATFHPEITVYNEAPTNLANEKLHFCMFCGGKLDDRQNTPRFCPFCGQPLTK